MSIQFLPTPLLPSCITCNKQKLQDSNAQWAASDSSSHSEKHSIKLDFSQQSLLQRSLHTEIQLFFRNVHHRTLITTHVTKQKKTTFSKWEPKNAFPHVTFKHSFHGSWYKHLLNSGGHTLCLLLSAIIDCVGIFQLVHLLLSLCASTSWAPAGFYRASQLPILTG